MYQLKLGAVLGLDSCEVNDMDRVNCWMPGVIPMSPWDFELYLPAIWRLRRHRSWLVDTRQQPSLFTSEEKHDSGSLSCCAEKERERERVRKLEHSVSFLSTTL